jgi:hypothetical protein
MSVVTGAWHHDDVVRLLARETPYPVVTIERMVLQLAALGWTQHQVRRGITTVARTGLSFDSLWRGAELAGGDVDGFLDALAGGHDADA